MRDFMLTYGEDLQVPLFFGLLLSFIVFEALFPFRHTQISQMKRRATNAGLTLLSILVLPVVPVTFISAATWAQSKQFGLFNIIPPFPFFAELLCVLLIRGFISFFTHFLNHKVPWLWRLHRVHHLDTELDVSSTVRFHPLEMPVSMFIGIPVVLLFGLDPWILIFYELFDVSVTLFSHSNIRLPGSLNRALRYIIVTPALHRVHHSSIHRETDSNFSAVFPVWDLVFGTFRTGTQFPPTTMQLGLDAPRDERTNSIGWLLVSPFIDINGAASSNELGATAVTAKESDT